MADSEGIAVPNPLLDHESGLRRLMADAAGEPYVAYTSLAEASADPHGAVILEGDDGGQIYVACPASSVRCSEEDLQRLLNDIDAFAWNDPDAAAVRYERRPGGSGIAGGMGGARVMAGVWVHEELQQLGLEAAIGEVLAGEPVKTIETLTVCIYCAAAGVAGRLIHTAPGRSGGRGTPLTKRSGVFA